MTDPTVSARVIEQRIHNRRIEWLEAAEAFEREPIHGGLNELVNRWDDWNPSMPSLVDYPIPVYTGMEATLLLEVATAFEAFCSATPRNIVSEPEVLAQPEWKALMGAVRRALNEMQQRGWLSESVEATD